MRSATMHHVGKITPAMAREVIEFIDTEWTPTEEKKTSTRTTILTKYHYFTGNQSKTI